ncbi:unnamed protein product [Allacma fusca]|uniref:Uncharacterized protein n=1 Tax=Allacma fusca TaxID=39272 RepID=A0A8J2L646_9HEXA|nr:unnamed protein product [Allacma fusca]
MKFFMVLASLVAAVNCQFPPNPAVFGNGLGQNFGGYGPAPLGFGNPNGFQQNVPFSQPGLGYAAANGVNAANSLSQGYQNPPLAQGYLGTQSPIPGQPGGPNPGQNQALSAANFGKK